MNRFILIVCILLFTYSCFCQKEVVLKKYPNGKPSLIAYYKEAGNTIEKVKEISYYSNGKIDYEGNFKDGKEHGRWVYYYENGQMMYEEFYKNGLEEGKHSTWAPDGKLLKEEIYKKGQLVQVVEF